MQKRWYEFSLAEAIFVVVLVTAWMAVIGAPSGLLAWLMIPSGLMLGKFVSGQLERRARRR